MTRKIKVIPFTWYASTPEERLEILEFIGKKSKGGYRYKNSQHFFDTEIMPFIKKLIKLNK